MIACGTTWRVVGVSDGRSVLSGQAITRVLVAGRMDGCAHRVPGFGGRHGSSAGRLERHRTHWMVGLHLRNLDLACCAEDLEERLTRADLPLGVVGHQAREPAIWLSGNRATQSVDVRAAGVAILAAGTIAWFPIAALRVGLLIAPRGSTNEERIAKTGPSAADLNQAAEQRVVDKAFRPVSVFFAGCLLVGGALVLLAA